MLQTREVVSSTLAIKHTTHGPGVEGSNPAKSISFGVWNGRQKIETTVKGEILLLAAISRHQVISASVKLVQIQDGLGNSCKTTGWVKSCLQDTTDRPLKVLATSSCPGDWFKMTKAVRRARARAKLHGLEGRWLKSQRWRWRFFTMKSVFNIVLVLPVLLNENFVLFK